MGILSKSQKEEAAAKIKDTYKGCPMCGPIMGRVTLADVVALPVLEKAVPSGVTPGSQFIPVIPVICDNCGHTTLFHASKYVDIT